MQFKDLGFTEEDGMFPPDANVRQFFDADRSDSEFVREVRWKQAELMYRQTLAMESIAASLNRLRLYELPVKNK